MTEKISRLPLSPSLSLSLDAPSRSIQRCVLEVLQKRIQRKKVLEEKSLGFKKWKNSQSKEVP